MTPIALPSPPRRILIIKPSAIGDVVHTLPVLSLIRGRWPDAHVAWLVTPACAGLLDDHPQLDEVIRFERRKFGAGWRSLTVGPVEVFRRPDQLALLVAQLRADPLPRLNGAF